MRLALVMLVATACDAPPDGGWNGEPVAARAMTWNVAGGETLVAQPWKGENLATLVARELPDFITVQECAPCGELVALLPATYAAAGDVADGIGVLYDTSRWWRVETDLITLGVNDDGWGPRHARRARFEHMGTVLTVDVYSTHYCVPIRRDDDACDEDRQLEYTERILEDLATHDTPAILGGDLNVFDGFAHGRVIARLREAGLTDAFAAAHPDDADDAVTFHGNTWAPPGRIDYVFTAPDVVVLDAAIDTSLPPGDGSDHDPVAADLLLGAR